jgi:hypothetical protein
MSGVVWYWYHHGMSALTKTPIVDKNGKQTYVYKSNTDVLSTRAIPSVPVGYYDGVDYSDYITNVWHGSNDGFSDDEVATAKVALRERVMGLISDMEADPEWLPEVYSFDEDDGDDEGMIRQMSDLTIPENSRGMCLGVSEAVAQYMQHKLHSPIGVVQGMPERHSELNVHYANLFESDGTPSLIVDLTYSQVDEMAEFPLILTPHEWVNRIQDDLRLLDERNAAH